MIDYSTYSLTLTATPPSSDPPPDWLTAANGTYTYTAPLFLAEGARYTNENGHTCDVVLSGGTYEFFAFQSGEEWVSDAALTESALKAGGTTSFARSLTNAIDVTWTFTKIPVKAELIYGETPTILEDSLSMEDGELGALDEATVDLLTAWPGYKAELTSVGITKNALVTHPDIPGIFYCRKLRPKPEGSARAITTASLVGILADEWEERRLREISAFGQQISVGPLEKIIIVTTAQETGEDPEDASTVPARRRIPKLDAEGEVEYKTIVTPSGSAERWNVNDPGITVIDTYFQRTAPSTTVIGTALTPPSAPTPPAYLWGTYSQPMRSNHPNGWVLADRKISIIIPDLVWKVVDTFEYYQVALPD